MWYCLVDDTTGDLLSAQSMPILTIKEGCVVVEQDTRDGIWNSSTRVFDPTPTPDKYIAKREYLNRLTDKELEDIIVASKSNVKLEANLKRLEMVERVKISGTRTLAVLQWLESQGVLATGRAQEIVDG